MAKDAFYFLIPLVSAAGAAFWLGWPVAGILVVAPALFVAFFFRDPRRRVPDGEGVVVAPADGRIVRIVEGDEGTEVSIFLSLFNVHINRSPIAGRVEAVEYRPGAYHTAFRDLAGAENERNTLTIRGADFAVTCSQIAGVVARRIVCWKQTGDQVERGERIGLIRFGSRVDLLLPPAARLEVRMGDRVRGGSSRIARVGPAPEPERK
jgi:phosphatidylserine decarboxylase